jgi:hypothetical protein
MGAARIQVSLGTGQGVLVLIAKSPQAVSANAHDHGA